MARVDALPHGRAQAFYFVLPDARDVPGGGVQYIAEDNVVALSSPAVAAAASPTSPPQQSTLWNQRLAHYFSEFVPALGVYLPNAHLEANYPRDAVSAMLLRAVMQSGAAARGGVVALDGAASAPGAPPSRRRVSGVQ